MIEKIEADTLLKIERILTENSEKGSFSPERTLSILKGLGFYTCFYYDAAPNIATDDFQLILSSVNGSQHHNDHLGSHVQYKNSAIGHSRGEGAVIQAPNDPNQTNQLRQHTGQLGVVGKCRIHTPIYHSGTLIGALSCSWDGECEILPSENKKAFSIISSMLSRHWALANEVLISSISSKLIEALPQNNEPTNLSVILENVANLTRAALKTQVVAVFQYDWYTARLNKIVESFGVTTATRIPESYRVGEFLTGKAWQDNNYRFIVDFSEFQKTYSIDVSQKSFDYHSRTLGTLKTIMYNPFGKKQKYFFRLMNRKDKSRFPFSSSHQVVLQGISNRIETIIDELVSEQRLTKLQLVAKTATSNVKDVDQTVKEINKALNNECVNNFGVMSYDERQTHFNYAYFTEYQLNRLVRGNYIEWKGDEFFESCVDCVNSGAIKAFEVEDFQAKVIHEHILSKLYADRVTFVIIVPFTSLRIKGFLIIPTSANITGTAQALISRLPQFHLNSLKAYAAVLGSCVETAQSHLTSENARRLIGQIGHEVQGPIAKLGQTALEVVYKTLDYFDEISENYPGKLDVMYNSLVNEEVTVSRQMKEINTFMNVAVDMALESHGIIQVHFDTYNLYKVMKAASDEIKQADHLNYQGQKLHVDFSYNNASQTMRDLVGDRNLLQKVFVNIFNNAVKYSIATGGKRLVKIDIQSQPQQSQHIIHITNWGTPIPESNREKIFNPFERGDHQDKLRAHRGMGLGLYIARRFLSAHRGTIRCVRSEPTLDDPSRRNIEGWFTTFEIRLPFGLKKGTFDHVY